MKLTFPFWNARHLMRVGESLAFFRKLVPDYVAGRGVTITPHADGTHTVEASAAPAAELPGLWMPQMQSNNHVKFTGLVHTHEVVRFASTVQIPSRGPCVVVLGCEMQRDEVDARTNYLSAVELIALPIAYSAYSPNTAAEPGESVIGTFALAEFNDGILVQQLWSRSVHLSISSDLLTPGGSAF